MTRANLIIPHPIIRPHGFDYNQDCNFMLRINDSTYTIDGQIHLKLSFDLSSSTINNFIAKNKAKYVVIMKSTKTIQRIILKSNKPVIHCTIPLSECTDKLTLTPYVICTQEIMLTYTNEHDDEIKNLINTGILLPVGSILAFGNSHEIEIDSLENVQAAIKISRENRVKEGTYEIDTNDDYIDITVHPNTYDKLSLIHNKSVDLLYPSIYVIAIERAIRDLKDNETRKWSQALSKTLKKYNIETDDEDFDDKAYLHAQTILEKPLTRILESGEGGDEND